jgi:hypothetical protein
VSGGCLDDVRSMEAMGVIWALRKGERRTLLGLLQDKA